MDANDEIDLMILQIVEDFKLKSREETKNFTREQLLNLVDWYIQENVEGPSKLIKIHNDLKFQYLMYGMVYGATMGLVQTLITAILSLVPKETQTECLASITRILYKDMKS
jgi:hypothetical protein